MKIAKIILIGICLFSFVHAHSLCGTANIIEHRKNPKAVFANALTGTKPSCDAEDYYDSIYTKKTAHFEIFFTLQGPHKTSLEFVDSVAASVESAWNFYANKFGMRPPLGDYTTYHYQKDVDEGLYPVEILDINLLRDLQYIAGGLCSGCYGLTIPSEKDPERSELIIENDFFTIPVQSPGMDSINVNGKTCTYLKATKEITNAAHNYSYTQQWAKGIRVTVIHELYHAIQTRYLDMTSHWNFWFEASASGVEEIVNPDIDDYFAYLPSMFKTMGTPINKMREDYGAGVFLIYLYKHVDKKMEKFLWEDFEKKPNASFETHLRNYAKTKNLSADSLFQDFSARLAFSGSRSNDIDSSYFICNDQPEWPSFTFLDTPISTPFEPSLASLSYKFFSQGSPYLEDFQGFGTAAIYRAGKAKLHPFKTSNEAESIAIEAENKTSIDSVVWIFSNLEGVEVMPTIIRDSTLRAYPTPWRGGTLCFTPLPRNKNFVEIRNRRGNLISRENYSKSTLCLEEHRVKELMAPGVYRFRVGNQGKTKDLLIIY